MRRTPELSNREKVYRSKTFISDIKRRVQQTKQQGDLSEYVNLVSKTDFGHRIRESLRDSIAEIIQLDPDNDLLSTEEFFGLIRDISALIEPIGNSGLTRILDRYAVHILQRLIKIAITLPAKKSIETYLDFANHCQAAITFLLLTDQGKTPNGKFILRTIDSFYIDGSRIRLEPQDKRAARALLLTLAKTIESHAAIHYNGDNTLALKAMLKVCEEVCEDLHNVREFTTLNDFSNNPDYIRWFLKFQQAIINHNSKQFNEWDKIKLPYLLNALISQAEVILENEAHPVVSQSQTQSYVQQLLENYCKELNLNSRRIAQAEVQNEVLVAGYPVDMTLTLGRYICIIEVDGPQHYNTNGDLRILDVYREEVIKQHLRNQGFEVNLVHIKSQDIGKINFGQPTRMDVDTNMMIVIDPLKYYQEPSTITKPRSAAPSKSKAVDSFISEQSRRKTGLLRDETNAEGKRTLEDNQRPINPGPHKH